MPRDDNEPEFIPVGPEEDKKESKTSREQKELF